MPRPRSRAVTSSGGKPARPRTAGAYILLFRLPEVKTISVGKLGTFRFPAGEYAYVGSALGGLEPRVGRHLKGGSSKHWHIDYVLDRAVCKRAILFPSSDDIECALAMELGAIIGTYCPADGFGSSDCACNSHLFWVGRSSIGLLRALVKSRRGILLR